MERIPEIEILYEDKDFIAINKPAGLIVHADGKTKEPAVTDWIIANYPEIVSVGEPIKTEKGQIERPGIVHRIDRETSGVLVIAKNKEAFNFLKDKFKNREVSKVYRAFVFGVPKNSRGVIERDIQRSKSDFRKWTAYSGRGTQRPAITHYRVLSSIPGMSYIEARPKTGRTHQIRVHLSSIGHPIIGDVLYGSRVKDNLGFERTALHAMSVSFTDRNGREIEIKAPLPDDFIKAEQVFKNIAKN